MKEKRGRNYEKRKTEKWEKADCPDRGWHRVRRACSDLSGVCFLFSQPFFVPYKDQRHGQFLCDRF